MSKNFPKPMPREVCCKNWAQLFNYLENSSDLRSGLSGRAAVEKLLEGLVGNPDFLIQDPKDPDVIYPVKEEHLKDPRYWHSNEFSVKLLENASKAIGGYRPLFQAGIIAGYKMLESAQPKHFQFLRLLSPKGIVRLVGFINKKFNNTKTPVFEDYRPGHYLVRIKYKEQYRDRISSHACDWNAGIYTGMAKYTGAHDTKIYEIACVNKGHEDCIFEINWDPLNGFRRSLVFFHSVIDPEYIRGRNLDNLAINDLVLRQEGIIEERTKKLKETQAQLIEADEIHINSIFSNLILNAKDALEEVEDNRAKEIKVMVEQRDDETGKCFVITVSDNGPGIPEEKLNEIFEPFYSTKPTTGTGLGLGVVKRLVHLYGGKINVKSKQPEGTTFEIVFQCDKQTLKIRTTQMDRIVSHWVERSEYDLDTAKAMLNTGRYLYVGYMCQQAVEKLLKAMIAQQNKENLPIHNLNRLGEIAEIADLLSLEQSNLLAELTPFCIEARYGDFKESLSEILDRDRAEIIYQQTREFFKWLYQKIS